MTRHLTIFVCLVLTFVGTAAVFGQADVPDFYQEPGVNNSREVSFDLLSGETIDPFGGVLRHQYQDLVLSGNGIDIAVTRTYHSIQKAPGIVGQPYLLGRTTTGVGWDIHFGRVYYEGPLTPFGCAIPLVGSEPLSSNNPTIELADGTRKVLFSSLPAVPEEFITKDRWVATCIPGVRSEGGRDYHDGGLEVRTTDGMKLTFDRRTRVKGAVGAAYTGKLAWHLTRMEDLNGNWIEVDYVDRALTQYTEIERIRAKDGRVVNFSYTNAGLGDSLLSQVEANGEIWRYEHVKLPNEALAYYHLDRVVGPEGLIWSYEYHTTGDGLHSLKKARAPTGGAVEYTYQRVDLGAFPSLSMDSTAVATKTTSGPDLTPGVWTYRFYREASDDFDYTEVTGPISREVYRHCGMRALSFSTSDVAATQCNAREGAILQKDTYSLAPSNLVQTELYEWGVSRVSDQWEKMPFRTYRIDGIYARRLHQSSILRDGNNYTTYYASFDAYDNPGVVTEYSGPILPYRTEPPADERRRDRVVTYEPDLTNWLLRLVTKETIPDIPVFTPSGTRNMQHVTERTFDARGNVKTQTVNTTNRTVFTYHPNGLVESIQDARGETTRLLDYFRGVPRREERPESVVILRDVDFDGTLTSDTNGRGFVTAYTYDFLDRMQSIVTPRTDDDDISVSYNFAAPVGSSNAKRTVRRGDFVEERVFDGFGRVVRVNADGIFSTMRYDAAGRKVFESYPTEVPPTGSEHGIIYEYDAIGRPTRVEHTADGAFVQYDYSSGDQMKVTNERGKETLYTYRAFGDPDARDVVVIDSPEDIRTKITRYQTGHPLTVSQGDANGPESDYLVRQFVLDSQYQLDYEFHPEHGLVQHLFDPLGNKIEENVETRLPTSFTYDGLNRIRDIDYRDVFTNNASYTYDDNGNLKTLTKFPTTWTFDYDNNDNLTRQTLEHSGGGSSRSFTIDYTYDTRDALSKITYPSGLEVDYAPNARGWPTKAGRFVDFVDYHANGAIRQLRYANGHLTTIDLDDRQRPDRFLSGNGAIDVMDLDYDYDFAGNVTHILDGLDPLKDRNFEYDDADRMTVANGAWGNGAINYDVFGNIRRKTIGATDLVYSYTTFGSLLTGVSGAQNRSFSYDRAGNIEFDGGKIYAHGVDDNLSLVRDNNRGINLRSYTYDGFNRRVAETRSGSSDTKFTVYDLVGNLLFELDPGRCEQRDYVRVGSMLVARRDQDIDTDTDLDEIPDCVELRWGLDPADPSDAAGDLDLDGLNNLDEYRLGTDLRNVDSDGDSMDDKFEVDFGLNPLRNDAGGDLDLDGATNLHEFLAGTLPGDPSSVPASGTTEWVFDDAAPDASSLVVDGDGTTFIYGADRSLHALDRFGQLVASLAPSAPAPEMVTADGRVLARTSNFLQAVLFDSDLVASAPIDISRRPRSGAAALPTGELALRHEDDVHLLDADGHSLWKRTFPPGSLIQTGPVVGADGTLYLGLFYGRIIAMDRFGNTKWWQSLPTRDVSHLAVGPDNVLIATDANRVFALSALGVELWSETLSYVPQGVVISGDGTVYIVGGEAKVDVMDPAGVLQPPLSVRSGQTQDVALGADGTLYVVSGSGFFVDALDATTGALHWEYGDATKIHPNLALTALGSLIVPQAGRVVSLSTDRVGPSADAWAMRGANAARSSARPACSSDDTDGDGVADCIERIEGLVVGVFDQLGDEDGDGLLNKDELALGTGIHVFDTDGDHIPDGYEVHEGLDPLRRDALDDTDGDGARNLHEFLLGTDANLTSSVPPSKSADRVGEVRVERSFPDGIRHLAIDRNDNLYLSVGTALYSVDAFLEDRWSANAGFVNGLALDDDNVYISDTSGTLRAIPLGGGTPNDLFTIPGLSRRLTRAAIGPDGTLYVGSGDNAIYAVDKTGGSTAEFTTGREIVAPPVVAQDGSVFVVSLDHFLYKLSPTLDELWSWDLGRGARSAPMILADGTVVVVTDSDFLHAITPARQERWVYSRFSSVFGTRTNAAPVVGTDETLLVQEQGHLRSVQPSGSLRWEEPGGDGRAPVVTWDGRVIFVHDDKLVFIDEDQSSRREISLGATIQAGPVLARDGTVYVATSTRLVGVIASEFGGLGISEWPSEAKNLRFSGYAGDIANEPRRSPVAPNEAPDIVISEPSDGLVFVAGSAGGLTFTASSSDREDGSLDAFTTWSSDRDGELGVGKTVTLGGATSLPELSIGAHLITARVLDHNGGVATARIDINVSSATNLPPIVTITAPPNGTRVLDGIALEFTATAADPEDGDLTNSIVWSSDRDGPMGTGGSVLATLSVGTHVVTATVVDSAAAGASDTLAVEVSARASTPAELSSPTPGSTIDTETIEFVWDPGVGVDAYFLVVGTRARYSNIYSPSGATTDVSAMVTGIPQSGGTIYATLYSFMNGSWESRDYTFTMGGSPARAALVSPSSGTILGETATFEWTPSNDMTQIYQVHIGTLPGRQDIYGSGLLTGVTSVDASGIPQSGGDVYVRLYSFLNNEWVYEAYDFPMSGTPTKATLTTPAAGATLGERATFEWNPSNNIVQQYQLHMGTADGWQDIFASGLFSGDTSAIVDGIPRSGGEVFVRLYSFLNNAWVYESYTFTMEGAPTRASLTLPTPATTLGASATFEWNPSNNNVRLYQLHIGTVDGWQDVFASGLVEGATSVAVSGIPQSGGNIFVRLYSYLNNEWVHEASSFRTGGVSTKAVLISPVAGTTLGVGATFEWSPSNDLSGLYQLHIGTADGRQDVFASGLLDGVTSVAVSGIPQSGGNVFIRLYSYLNNEWVYEPSSFRTGGVPTKAAMTAPGAGTLLGPGATFEWSPSNDLSGLYQLHIGTADGWQDVFSSGLLIGVTSVAVSGIPQSGGNVFVRLYSYLNNAWVHEPSVFTMGGIPTKATILAPVAGTTIAESETFTWSPSNNKAQLYQLHVGSSAGGQDVFASGLLDDVESVVVSGVPRDGRTLYVRLYSYLNNAWVYQELTYTAGP